MIPTMSSSPRLGILGGGQLGRMMMMAGAGYGVRFAVWDASGDAPAMQLATTKIVGGFDDKILLQEFLSASDAVMIEWENIPVSLVAAIAAQKPIIAPANILEIAQSRLAEKNFFLTTDIKPVPFVAIAVDDGKAAIEKKITAAAMNFPAILKTDRMGYDGKGQYQVKTIDEVLAVTAEHKINFILEQKINFSAEGSVLVARDFHGGMAAYPMVENEHRNGILHRTLWPSKNIANGVASKAVEATKKMAVALNLHGLLCVEYFVTDDGTILANEMAPRPHNSFHWTIEGTNASQFLQMARIALGLHVIPPMMQAKDIAMYNILGDDIKNAAELANSDGHFLHLYGKDIAKPDRKMGHYTILR